MTLEYRKHALHLMVVFDNLVPFKDDEQKYITKSYFVTYFVLVWFCNESDLTII